MRQWVLLVYRVPNEPSAKRVFVWRKLKRLGAILLNDAAWVLPANEHTREQFQWLANEIVEREGEASVWDSHILPTAQEESLIRQFNEQVEEVYREILADLDKQSPDLPALSRRYQEARTQDYFNSPIGQRARKSLLALRGASQ